MVELGGLAQYFTMTGVVLSLTVILQVSYKVSAYRRVDELSALEALGEELEDNYMYRPEETLQESTYNIDDSLPTDKRYARLSYYYGNKGRSNRKYYHNRYYQNYYKPWLNLPDTECFRKECSSDKGCCRRFSKCDKSAHICYNCWYGHPCRSQRDCCERYPYCNKNTHGGRCQN